uniref:Uncharacterized protein n=1 Tax=Timema cristinae TaxID=61476 RepID=A0A7R9GW28_TIMCR|nr:unnamed protein product [Timema cristinae]
MESIQKAYKHTFVFNPCCAGAEKKKETSAPIQNGVNKSTSSSIEIKNNNNNIKVVTRHLTLCGNYAPQHTHHANSHYVATVLPSLTTTRTPTMWQLCFPAYPPRELSPCGNYAPQPTHHANSYYVATMLPSLPTTRLLKQFN